MGRAAHEALVSGGESCRCSIVCLLNVLVVVMTIDSIILFSLGYHTPAL